MSRLLTWGSGALVALAGLLAQPAAAADDTIRFGYSELLSGAFAQVGDQGIKTSQTVISSLAINLRRTGEIKPVYIGSHKMNDWFQARGKVEFVGDGEPSQFDGCIIYGNEKHMSEYFPQKYNR